VGAIFSLHPDQHRKEEQSPGSGMSSAAAPSSASASATTGAPRKKKKTATGGAQVVDAAEPSSGPSGSGSSAASGSSMSSNDMLQQCYAILKSMQEEPDAVAFLEPVRWKELRLTDYPVRIKKPMDLGTVQTKLDSGKYSSPEKFASDVRLVWKNAMFYNRRDSDIFVAAQNLAKLFEKKFAKLRKAGTPAGAGTKRKGDGSKAEGSRANKVWFSQMVKHLDSEQLGQVVSMIQKDCPEALNEEDDDVLEIEINAIDAGTLTQIINFCNTCISVNDQAKMKTKAESS